MEREIERVRKKEREAKERNLNHQTLEHVLSQGERNKKEAESQRETDRQRQRERDREIETER